MNRAIPFALSLALIAPALHAQDDTSKSAEQEVQAQQQQQQQQQDAQAQAAAAKQQSGQQQDPVQMFIMEAYSSNLFEIQAGQLAQKQAQSQEIKQFAQMMMKDHQQANQQLKQLAQSAGAQVQEQLDPVHQAKLQKLQQLPQTEFDRKYINGQASGHMANVLEFTYQSKNAQNDQVKQFATKMLPQLEQHLKHATDLAGQQAGGGGEAQPASAKQPADQQQQQQQEQQQQDQGTSGATQQK